MALGFPLLVELTGNNCTVFGGNKSALRRVNELLRFGAKVTVISPTICTELEQMSAQGIIRHIPRKYFRGDCSNSQICVAATDDSTLNIAISTECKNKGIPVNVTTPRSYGNFTFPRLAITEDVILSITGTLPADTLNKLQDRLQEELPAMIAELNSPSSEESAD